MDRLSCHVIYVNRVVGEDGLIHASSDVSNPPQPSNPSEWKRDHVRELVKPLLEAFGDVHICSSGSACLSTLFQLQDGSMTSITPTLVLLDTPFDDHLQDQLARSRSSSPPAAAAAAAAVTSLTSEIHTPNEELYGLGLLQKIITEAHLRSMSKLVVTVPVISYSGSSMCSTGHEMTDGASESPLSPEAILSVNRRLIRTCLDLGAADVLISPISSKCVTTLEICAYKAQRDATKDQQEILEVTKGRKRSWVGINEQKPFAYLREAMVSGLMNGICRLDGNDGQITGAHVAVSSRRQVEIAHAVGHWHFCAHSFSDDELLVAALVMFKHALVLPELEPWRLSADQLVSYLVACRAAYNSFVPYHNFRHVVDVLQATFNFLVRIGALPPYPSGHEQRSFAEKSPMAGLLTPFEALTLLITAIGHDVGHPGVNNGFLATLNAPLAQLYNDRSVLESFHCAAYSQILRRYWPSAFEDRKMRSLMISSILATDMGLHFDYMKKLGDAQERLQHNKSIKGWSGRQIEDHKALACSLLIKCADISNVARHHDAALKWMYILSEEFSRQASMEEELDIKSSLLAQPKKDILSLATAQLGFMNVFAIPLFEGVADIMPAMRYVVDELETNKGLFEKKLQEEKARQTTEVANSRCGICEGTLPPRTPSRLGESNGQPYKSKVNVPAERPESTTDGANEESGGSPRAVADDVQQQARCAVDELAEVGGAMPKLHYTTHDENANASAVDSVRHLADNDPFNFRFQGDGGTESKATTQLSRQRCSENTEGSTFGASSGDWQSQATTATTGRLALSPSTQGTSIVSTESLERRLSATGLKVSPPSTSSHESPRTVIRESVVIGDKSAHGGSIGKAEGKSLRKKTSRFRMKDFSFFRRQKAASPPLPSSDTTT
ncbi:uncharacterized protein UV8b_03876 [Ustilaginoidea virens]|uniref:Phosphodiesterase n=1 Tax=Ustilaginoidea virens TaxID=1159556 RepID=A0A063BS83_USTVR|nr:uncharacterized protein UV8b_03876 [Ustilaginoidea virens]QUC19635.1 hypothetical protein UV8b_03876 [Ustilaginoidea virens]GAO13889.1 hypothetical protein UVI_02003950 [Ustilaginoidea virens]